MEPIASLTFRHAFVCGMSGGAALKFIPHTPSVRLTASATTISSTALRAFARTRHDDQSLANASKRVAR
jgi:hypothetical protein